MDHQAEENGVKQEPLNDVWNFISPVNGKANVKNEGSNTKSKSKRTRQVKNGFVKQEGANSTKKSRAKSLDNRNKTPPKRKIIEDEEIDSYELECRDTNAYGIIKEHKNPIESGIYKIGKVLGSGMIGVACLCQEENHNLLSCLKLMSIEKIREKNLFKNIKDEVQIMYDLIGVGGVC